MCFILAISSETRDVLLVGEVDVIIHCVTASLFVLYYHLCLFFIVSTFILFQYVYIIAGVQIAQYNDINQLSS